MNCYWAVHAKKIITGEGHDVVEDGYLVLQGERIVALVPPQQRQALSTYPVSSIVERPDAVLIPGLIDVHVHLMLPGDGRTTEDILGGYTPQENVLLARQNAESALKRGVTTLRDCGSAHHIALNLRNFIRSGHWNGPDILTAGMPLTSSCGHCLPMGGAADGADALIRLIRQQWFDGADFCKIMASAGATRGVRRGMTFRPEELQAAVDEAHRLGMSVSIHTTEIDAVRAAVNAGADRLEHAYFMDYCGEKMMPDENLAAEIRQKNIMVCHTLPVIHSSVLRMQHQLELNPQQPELKQSHDYYQDIQNKVETLFRFHVSQGIAFAAGSDSGWRNTPFESGMIMGLEIMEKNGVAPMDALLSATAEAARYIDRADCLGRLEAGYQADFVVLGSDPSQTTAALYDVREVYKRGKLVK